MTKFQFFLVSTLITSVMCLLIGSRDGSFNVTFPVATILALAYLGNRFVSETVWDRFAVWANRTAGRYIFRVRTRRLPPSRSRRLR